MTAIAFLGVGNMGGPMALNLLKAGFPVRVFDLTPALLEPLVKAGAQAGRDAADTVSGTDIVISMLPSGAIVERLFIDDTCLLSAMDPGSLIIDCSTVGPETSKRLHAEAAKRGIDSIDAPVSGGVAGAQAGTLSFLCGGDAAVFERAHPILAAMGKNIMHAGGCGAGAIAKICNNMLLAIHMIGSCEALALGVANGLDPKVLSEIMQKSSGRNWSLEVYNPWPGVMDNVPSARGYQGGFQTDLMAKDLGLAVEAAVDSRSSIPLGALARQLYSMHSGHGHGKEDFSGILKMLANLPS